MRQDNIKISPFLILLFASPTTYRSSRIVCKRTDRSFSASIWANFLLHLVLELEVRVEEYSASKAASVEIHLSAFGIGRQNLFSIGVTDGPLFGGAAFTGIVGSG